MSKVYLLIGVPGSGKTTWAEKFSKESGAVHLSRDRIRFSYLERYKSSAYFAFEKKVIKDFKKQINFAIDSNLDVIIDATHVTPASRQKIINSIHSCDEVIAVFFPIPLCEALSRNSKRVGLARVPDEAIERMYNSLIAPSIELEKYINKVWVIDYE